MAIRPEIYKFFADYVFRHTGIYYPEQNYYQLDARLSELANHFCFDDVEKVYQGYATNVTPQMHQLLIDIATNNETSFFRDQSPYKALVNIVRQMYVEPKTNLTIWSAACSGGQEPYSIVMTLCEAGFDMISGRISIFATDLSQRILAKAAAGTYNQLEVQRGLSIQMLMKYFEQKEKKMWQIKDAYRNAVKFGTFNLLSDIYPRERYDIIFCRNVLIYQTVQNKEKILNSLYDAIAPGGCVILGNAENIMTVETKFVPSVEEKCTIFWKKGSLSHLKKTS